MSDPVLQTVPLGAPPWPTVDPFLFCVHHLDAYPAGDERFGPASGLDDRELGADFSARNGFSMYHGRVVPGFPQHPHRGFETVTYVRRGIIDHSDSLGAAARFGRGDTQWLTAGGGIVHSEMFPLLAADADNPLELFQIWMNLPAVDKLVEPHFAMLWDQDTPRLESTDDAGRTASVTVIAGELAGLRPASPPPHSWASRPDSDVAIWHVHLDPGASWTMPAAVRAETVRTLYLFEGESLSIDEHVIAGSTAALLDPEAAVRLASKGGAEALILQGRPIGEPVAQYGPFVMNDQQGIQQAFEDYRRTEFGGWPWPDDDPVHGDATVGRFARHADGHVETIDEPATSAVAD
jgi:redox-sensitive bicupin YhaK (pirin superfamily)